MHTKFFKILEIVRGISIIKKFRKKILKEKKKEIITNEFWSIDRSANEIAAKENDKQKLDKRRGAQMRVTMPEMEEVDCLRILLSTLALLADTIRVGSVLESWPTGTKLRVYTTPARLFCQHSGS